MANSNAAFKADWKLGEFCIIIILQIQRTGQESIFINIGVFNRSGEYIQIKHFDTGFNCGSYCNNKCSYW